LIAERIVTRMMPTTNNVSFTFFIQLPPFESPDMTMHVNLCQSTYSHYIIFSPLYFSILSGTS
jgi:hypothetical protein